MTISYMQISCVFQEAKGTWSFISLAFFQGGKKVKLIESRVENATPYVGPLWAFQLQSGSLDAELVLCLV